eukprot:6463342-Amphidinium_carterae.2
MLLYAHHMGDHSTCFNVSLELAPGCAVNGNQLPVPSGGGVTHRVCPPRPVHYGNDSFATPVSHPLPRAVSAAHDCAVGCVGQVLTGASQPPIAQSPPCLHPLAWHMGLGTHQHLVGI